jgi:type II secretory pathway pseudopilin PulG
VSRADRPRRGLSLVEAVAALAIVGATSLGALSVASSGTHAAERARRAHEANALLEEQRARLALAAEGELRLLPDSLAAGRFDVPFAEYAWRSEVQPDPRYPGLFAITVEVRWNDGVVVAEGAEYRPPAGQADGTVAGGPR